MEVAAANNNMRYDASLPNTLIHDTHSDHECETKQQINFTDLPIYTDEINKLTESVLSNESNNLCVSISSNSSDDINISYDANDYDHNEASDVEQHRSFTQSHIAQQLKPTLGYHNLPSSAVSKHQGTLTSNIVHINTNGSSHRCEVTTKRQWADHLFKIKKSIPLRSDSSHSITNNIRREHLQSADTYSETVDTQKSHNTSTGEFKDQKNKNSYLLLDTPKAIGELHEASSLRAENKDKIQKSQNTSTGKFKDRKNKNFFLLLEAPKAVGQINEASTVSPENKNETQNGRSDNTVLRPPSLNMAADSSLSNPANNTAAQKSKVSSSTSSSSSTFPKPTAISTTTYPSGSVFDSVSLSSSTYALSSQKRLRLILAGDAGVGKSTFLQTLINGMFTPLDAASNVFSSHTTFSIVRGGQHVEIEIQDTAGQERFRSLTGSYYRYAQGCLVFFNVHDEESFRNVPNWLQDIELYNGKSENLSVVLVGLLHRPLVSLDESRQRKIGLMRGHSGGNSLSPSTPQSSGTKTPNSFDSKLTNYKHTNGKNSREINIEVISSRGSERYPDVTQGDNLVKQTTNKEKKDDNKKHNSIKRSGSQNMKDSERTKHNSRYGKLTRDTSRESTRINNDQRSPLELCIEENSKREIPREQAEHMASVWGIPYKEVDTKHSQSSVMDAVHTLLDMAFAQALNTTTDSIFTIRPGSASLESSERRSKSRCQAC